MRVVRNTPKRKLFILFGLLAVSVLLMIACFAAMAMDDTIYHGVSVAGVAVGGKNVEQAKELLDQAFPADRLGETIRFACTGREFEIQRDAIGLAYDWDTAVQEAYDTGRAANPFARVGKMLVLRFAKQDIPLPIIYDEATLETLINENIHDLCTEAVPAKIEVLDSRLQITNGTNGKGPDMEQLRADLERLMADRTFGRAVEIALVTIPAAPIDIDQLCADYLTGPKDASYEISGGHIEYIPQTLGISFDREEALAVLEANRSNPEPYTIDIAVTQPAMTLEQLKNSLFQDKLGSYTSKYNPGEVGRTQNVSLAAQKINGTCLAPGDQFSFNTVVGERTAAAGFQNAKVYEGGNLVDGLGGGICQVSSTLYNAVLYADLAVVYRTNHSMPVTYAPLGRDATVAFGSIDFIFKNNKQNPVKVTSSASGGSLTISIWGTRENGREVEITTERLSTIPYPTKEIQDDSLAPGTKKVKQNGSDGAVINTYKTVRENGVVVSSDMIHKSYYNPIEKIVLVGPEKEVEPPAEQAPQPDDGQPASAGMADDAGTGQPAPPAEPEPELEPEQPEQQPSLTEGLTVDTPLEPGHE